MSSEPTPHTTYDGENATKPLLEFHEAAHEIDHSARADAGPWAASPRPSDLRDKYLMPTLTRNERIRLTMMWYHTRTLAEDQELLQKLQTTLALVRSFVGWPVVVCGIMDNHSYLRVATEGFPKASLPRRETMCAHTINSDSGVMVIPSMLNDWRFNQSPPVEFDGLRAYGGATLRCTTESGESLALGTLCVAADVETELPPDKQAALVQFADILSAEIVNRSRQARQRQRQLMNDRIAQVKRQASPENVEELVLQALKDEYPMARVTLHDSDDDVIELENRESVTFGDFEDGLWEDSELLDTLILTRNHEELSSDSTIRAIVTRCRKKPHPRFLIVASKKVQLVFDDVDSWFVQACGDILFDCYQEQLLDDAINAKDLFLRSVTHQLRTPIHGVIASVEMLAEELSSKAVTGFVKGPQGITSRVDTEFASRAGLYLTSIRSAGRELMSTINNMLMLNRWAESSRSMKPAGLHELNELEAAVLHSISQIASEDEGSTSIIFDNMLPAGCGVIIDIALLKEALKALILNAIQATPDGSIHIVISATQDYSVLQFDIYDSGYGISRESQERIFGAYEKGNTHSRGVGLGLTIASKIANAMNGCVYLVSSDSGQGSHFRAEFHNPGFACPTSREAPIEPKTPPLQKLYYIIPTGEAPTPLVKHFVSYLEHRNYQKSDQSQGALSVVSFTEDESRLHSYLGQVDDNAVALCLIPCRVRANQLRLPHHDGRIMFIEGPFLSTKLREHLKKVDTLLYNIREGTPPRTGSQPNGYPQGLDEVLHRKLRISDPVRALLVDDNAINLRVLKMYCEKRRVPYALAMDGNEAVSHYTSNLLTTPFNLVLMDLQMPNCDGIEATRRIRAFEQDTGLAPAVIFIITGQDSPGDKSDCKNAGVDEFFVKPMSIKTLDSGIDQYFSR
ncbi:hypothetical protein BKA80DRAFT_253389 [Phyllosticta citrichinensis]